jgi:hypothetical protein
LPKAMTQFKHETPNNIQTSPHQHTAIQYRAKTQFVADKEVSPPLNKEEMKYIQTVVGTLLYYAKAVNPTILPALSTIGTKQATSTQATMETIKQLLDYCATQEEVIIMYSASKNDFTHTQQRRILQ